MKRKCLGIGLIFCMSVLAAHAIGAVEVLDAVYWRIDRETRAVLEISNTHDQPRIVNPVLFLGGTEKLRLDPLTILAQGQASLSIAEALASRAMVGSSTFGAPMPRVQAIGNGSRIWGSIAIEGESLTGLTAWIRSDATAGGFSVNSMFEPQTAAARRLWAQWWKPTPSAKVIFLIRNVSTESVSATWSEVGFENPPPNEKLQLLAGETKQLVPRSISASGTIEIATSSGAPALLGLVILEASDEAFSVPVLVHRPATVDSVAFTVPGIVSGEPTSDEGFLPGHKFHPMLLLTNLSSESRKVGASAQKARPFDALELDHHWYMFQHAEKRAKLDTFHLPPRTTRVVDLATDVRGMPSGISSLHLRHNGRPGDVIATPISVDESLAFTFYDPFIGLDRMIVAQTGVSFELSGWSRQIFVVENVAEAVGVFSLEIGDKADSTVSLWRREYAIEGQSVATLDIGRLRDEGVPSDLGLLLSPSLTQGFVRIAAAQPGIMVSDLAFDNDGSRASCADPCECDPPGFQCIVPGLPGSKLEIGDGLLQCGNTPDPPTQHDSYTRTYKYGLQSVSGPQGSPPTCTYGICPAQQFLGACSSSVSLTGFLHNGLLQACFQAATQTYRIRTFWPPLVTCNPIGPPATSLPNCL